MRILKTIQTDLLKASADITNRVTMHIKFRSDFNVAQAISS
jgi:hypothetical protein